MRSSVTIWRILPRSKSIYSNATKQRNKRGARSKLLRARAATCERSSWHAPKRWSSAVLKLASDENVDGDILRGLLRRLPELDVVRILDVGLAAAPDPSILHWAAAEERILLTHDRDTL